MPQQNSLVCTNILLLLILWSGVATAVGVTESLRLPNNRKEAPETEPPVEPRSACKRLCNGHDFGTGLGTCEGEMKLSCNQQLDAPEHIEMYSLIEMICTTHFTNATTPTEDGMQTRLTCHDTMTMTADVDTRVLDAEQRSVFRYKYTCEGSFSSVINQDIQQDGSVGLNFFQNSVCSGTEKTDMQYSTVGNPTPPSGSCHEPWVGDLLKNLTEMGGYFFRVDMGGCSDAASLLSSVDILGVFYSYVVIPGCEPEPSEKPDPYSIELISMPMYCNGAQKDIRESCRGLFLGMAQIGHGTVTSKCDGHWYPRSDTTFVCSGSLSGEQTRTGLLGKYVRSTLCGGKNIFRALYRKDFMGREWSGSENICTQTSVKSTIFGPISL